MPQTLQLTGNCVSVMSGVFVSPSGVRSIWLRHGLANFKNLLKALEEKIANDNGLILTESQVQALEKKKLDNEQLV